MDVGKLLLGATVGMVLLAVVLLGAVFVVPGTLFDGGPPASAEDLSDDDLPDGVSTSGVENSSAAAADHENALRGQSYTVEFNFTRRVSGGDGAPTTSVRLVQIRADGNGNKLLNVTRRGSGPFERIAWTNGTVAVARVSSNGRTEFQRMDPDNIERGATGATTIGEILRVGNFEPTNVTTVDGRRLVVLTADTANRRAKRLLEAQRIQSFSGIARVDDQGRFHYLRVEVTYIDGEGRRVTQTLIHRLTGVGATSVEKPEWVPRAIEEVSRLTSPPVVA